MQLRLGNVHSRLNALRENAPERQEEEIGGRETLNEERDLRQIFAVLRTQKKGIDKLVDGINESTKDLMVMERELNIQAGITMPPAHGVSRI